MNSRSAVRVLRTDHHGLTDRQLRELWIDATATDASPFVLTLDSLEEAVRGVPPAPRRTSLTRALDSAAMGRCPISLRGQRCHKSIMFLTSPPKIGRRILARSSGRGLTWGDPILPDYRVDMPPLTKRAPYHWWVDQENALEAYHRRKETREVS